MKTREYKCCVCKTIFSSNCYSWIAYYSEGKFHNCPNCDSKLVENYDFERIGFLDKVSIRLFILAAMAWVFAFFFRDWRLIGTLAYSIPALAGIVAHVMYRSVISDIKENKIQETRMLKLEMYNPYMTGSVKDQ